MSFASDALMLYPERDRDREDTDSGDTARSRRHDTGVSQIEFRIPRSEAFFSQPATDPGTNDDDCTGIGCRLTEKSFGSRNSEFGNSRVMSIWKLRERAVVLGIIPELRGE